MLHIDLKKEKQKFQNYLQNSKKILLVNHRRMDGDAYGSLAWFYYLLEKMWIYSVLALNDDPTPENFHFLDCKEIFSQKEHLQDFSPDLIITFDAASLEQLWNIYSENISLFQSTTWVNIDHHISNSGFGNIHIIDLQSSSTCEIIWDLIKEFDLTHYMDNKISTFLLTGVITDTNSFFNTNSTPKALKTASELMHYDPRHQDIIINLFKKKPFERLKLWWKVLESLKDMWEEKVVWNTLPKSLFIETKTTDKDISWLIDELLTTINTLEIGFLLYELEDGSIKGSFRSKNSPINLDNFCAHWWWGGHSKAAGFVISGKTLYQIEQEVLWELKKSFD